MYLQLTTKKKRNKIKNLSHNPHMTVSNKNHLLDTFIHLQITSRAGKNSILKHNAIRKIIEYLNKTNMFVCSTTLKKNLK